MSCYSLTGFRYASAILHDRFCKNDHFLNEILPSGFVGKNIAVVVKDLFVY